MEGEDGPMRILNPIWDWEREDLWRRILGIVKNMKVKN